jgi:hypothetical protein
MEIFNLDNIRIYPLEERDKNVLFQSETFKVRLIQIGSGGEISPCAMATNVLFCVLQGEGVITVSESSNQVKSHSLIIRSLATVSMKSDEGMRVLGIQIVGGET